jgi:hypothetical protein
MFALDCSRAGGLKKRDARQLIRIVGAYLDVNMSGSAHSTSFRNPP